MSIGDDKTGPRWDAERSRVKVPLRCLVLAVTMVNPPCASAAGGLLRMMEVSTWLRTIPRGRADLSGAGMSFARRAAAPQRLAIGHCSDFRVPVPCGAFIVPPLLPAERDGSLLDVRLGACGTAPDVDNVRPALADGRFSCLPNRSTLASSALSPQSMPSFIAWSSEGITCVFY